MSSKTVYRPTRKTSVIVYEEPLEDLVIENKDENFLDYFTLNDIQEALDDTLNLKEPNLMSLYQPRSDDTKTTVNAIRSSEIVFTAYEDENGSIGVEGVVTFPGRVKITKKMMKNLTDFVYKSGVATLVVATYMIHMGDTRAQKTLLGRLKAKGRKLFE